MVGGFAGERFGSFAPFAEPPWYNAINSPHYKDSHRRLRRFIREYVDEHIIPNCEEWEASGQIPREAAQRHAQLGFVAAGIFPPPVEYMSNIKLPADIPANGIDAFCSFLGSLMRRMGCFSRFDCDR
jgi:hypothetical protein